jgi:hypothetical protein
MARYQDLAFLFLAFGGSTVLTCWMVVEYVR